MSFAMRIAASAFLLSCAMALTGYGIQSENTPEALAVYADKVETFSADVRGISLDLSTEEILSDPKLEADRAALMKRMEQFQNRGQRNDTARAVRDDTSPTDMERVTR